MPKKSTTSKRANTFKRSNKRPQWQLPLLAVLVAAAVGFGIFVVFFSKAGTAVGPHMYMAASNNTTDPTFTQFDYGVFGDKYVAGDWNKDGKDTLGAYRSSNSTFYLTNNNSSAGVPGFGFGNSGDIPIAGDWNGDGTTTVGVYRPTTGKFYLRNSNSTDQAGVKADVETLMLGNLSSTTPDKVPIACDWNGDGITDLGLFRTSTAEWETFASYGQQAGAPWIGYVATFVYGNPGDKPVCGDWDSNKTATPGVYRDSNSTFYLKNTNDGAAGWPQRFGQVGFLPLVGRWIGTAQTLIGAYSLGTDATTTTPTTPTTAPGSGSTATPATIDGDANTCATKTLRKGNTGTCINVLHQLLALRGSQYQVDYTEVANRTFGDSTVAKVRAFQTDRRIGVDGVVGPQSWGQLKIATATSGSNTGAPGQQASGIPAGCPGSAAAGPPAPGACDSYISSCTEKNLQTAYYESLAGQMAGARDTVKDAVYYIYARNYNFKYDWFEGFKDNVTRNIFNTRDQNSIVKAACARKDVYGTLTAIAARKRFAQAAIDIIYRRAQEVCVPLLNLPKAVSLLKNKEWYYE